MLYCILHKCNPSKPFHTFDILKQIAVGKIRPRKRIFVSMRNSWERNRVLKENNTKPIHVAICTETNTKHIGVHSQGNLKKHWGLQIGQCVCRRTSVSAETEDCQQTHFSVYRHTASNIDTLLRIPTQCYACRHTTHVGSSTVSTDRALATRSIDVASHTDISNVLVCLLKERQTRYICMSKRHQAHWMSTRYKETVDIMVDKLVFLQVYW